MLSSPGGLTEGWQTACNRHNSTQHVQDLCTLISTTYWLCSNSHQHLQAMLMQPCTECVCMVPCRTRWDEEGLDPDQPLLRVGLANRRRDTPYEGMQCLTPGFSPGCTPGSTPGFSQTLSCPSYSKNRSCTHQALHKALVWMN